MKKTLSLKKETLARLGDDELCDVVGGTATYTCGCTATGGLTSGYSCAGVCSFDCATSTCPDIRITTLTL